MSLRLGNTIIPSVSVKTGGAVINNQDKTVTPTTSQQTVTADSGYSGLGTVIVDRIPTNYLIPSGNKSITANGTGIDVAQYATVSVNVPTGSTINNQNKTVTPTTASQSITADSGYTGLGTVTVNAMPAGSAGTPTATKGTVSNHSISVTPSVTNTTGYITGSTKTGTAVTVSASELVSGNKAITANGTNIDVANYSTVSVNVPVGSTINNQNKTVNPSTAQQTVTADSGYTGLGTVTVNAIQTETKSITSNGTYSPSSGKYFSNVSVNVPVGTTINNQNKTATPTEAEQNITFDSGYTGLGTVTVEAISSTYIGSGITQRTSSSLSASGATVTVPAGYYATQATKSVASGSATTPATTITANPTLSTTYTSGSGYKMSVSKTQNVTPTVSAGYVSSGTAGTITVSGSAYVAQSAITNNTTLPSGSSSSGTINEGSYLKIGAGYYPTDRYYMAQARTNGSATGPTSLSGTSASISTSSNTLTLTKTGITTTPTVSAGYVSSATASTATVTLSASVNIQGTTTYRASTSAQTIASNTYLTGIQTIAAVSQTNLSAANIKAGTTISISNGSSNIWSVAGTFTSDATAAAADIASGKTAYVNGSKLTGSLSFITYYTGTSTPSSSLGSNGDIYLKTT